MRRDCCRLIGEWEPAAVKRLLTRRNASRLLSHSIVLANLTLTIRISFSADPDLYLNADPDPGQYFGSVIIDSGSNPDPRKKNFTCKLL